MNWDALGALGEIVGACGVIASLFYVGYQIRQNTVHSRAYTQRDILTEITADHLISGDKSALYRRALTKFSELPDDEKLEASSVLMTLINRFEATMRLHSTGLVDDSLFKAHRAWVLAHILSPGGEQWWELVKHIFSEDLRTYLDSAITDSVDLPRPVTSAIPFFDVTER